MSTQIVNGAQKVTESPNQVSETFPRWDPDHFKAKPTNDGPGLRPTPGVLILFDDLYMATKGRMTKEIDNATSTRVRKQKLSKLWTKKCELYEIAS